MLETYEKVIPAALEGCLRACISAGHVRPINDSLLVYQYVLYSHVWALKQW